MFKKRKRKKQQIKEKQYRVGILKIVKDAEKRIGLKTQKCNRIFKGFENNDELEEIAFLNGIRLYCWNEFENSVRLSLKYSKKR